MMIEAPPAAAAPSVNTEGFGSAPTRRAPATRPAAGAGRQVRSIARASTVLPTAPAGALVDLHRQAAVQEREARRAPEKPRRAPAPKRPIGVARSHRRRAQRSRAHHPPRQWKKVRPRAHREGQPHSAAAGEAPRMILPTVTNTGVVSQERESRGSRSCSKKRCAGERVRAVVPPKNLRPLRRRTRRSSACSAARSRTRPAACFEVELSLAQRGARHVAGRRGRGGGAAAADRHRRGRAQPTCAGDVEGADPEPRPDVAQAALEGVCSVSTRRWRCWATSRNLAVVQLRAQFGQHSGYCGCSFPQTVPPPRTSGRRVGSAAKRAPMRPRTRKGWVG